MLSSVSNQCINVIDGFRHLGQTRHLLGDLSIDDDSRLAAIVDELKAFGTVSVDSNMVIICIVGDLEWHNTGFEGRVLAALGDIPVRMISYGGSNYNISVLVRAEDKVEALRRLSKHLFE